MTTTSSDLAGTATNLPPCPDHIQGRARHFWEFVRDREYTLRPDEMIVLRDAAFEMMVVEEMERHAATVIESGELYVTGSQGQPVMNPIFKEIETKKGAVMKMLKYIALPDLDEDMQEALDGQASAAGQALVNARWSRTQRGG